MGRMPSCNNDGDFHSQVGRHTKPPVVPDPHLILRLRSAEHSNSWMKKGLLSEGHWCRNAGAERPSKFETFSGIDPPHRVLGVRGCALIPFFMGLMGQLINGKLRYFPTKSGLFHTRLLYLYATVVFHCQNHSGSICRVARQVFSVSLRPYESKGADTLASDLGILPLGKFWGDLSINVWGNLRLG